MRMAPPAICWRPSGSALAMGVMTMCACRFDVSPDVSPENITWSSTWSLWYTPAKSIVGQNVQYKQRNGAQQFAQNARARLKPNSPLGFVETTTRCITTQRVQSRPATSFNISLHQVVPELNRSLDFKDGWLLKMYQHQQAASSASRRGQQHPCSCYLPLNLVKLGTRKIAAPHLSSARRMNVFVEPAVKVQAPAPALSPPTLLSCSCMRNHTHPALRSSLSNPQGTRARGWLSSHARTVDGRRCFYWYVGEWPIEKERTGRWGGVHRARAVIKQKVTRWCSCCCSNSQLLLFAYIAACFQQLVWAKTIRGQGFKVRGKTNQLTPLHPAFIQHSAAEHPGKPSPCKMHAPTSAAPHPPSSTSPNPRPPQAHQLHPQQHSTPHHTGCLAVVDEQHHCQT